MPKTRNGFYLWCGGVFLVGTFWTALHTIGEVIF